MEYKAVVLFVDDQEETLDNMVDILADKGFLLIPYSDGRKVIDDLRGGLRYDIALVDLSLPDIGGDEVIRTLKRYYPKLMQLYVFLVIQINQKKQMLYLLNQLFQRIVLII